MRGKLCWLGLTVLLAMAVASGLRAQKPDDPFPLPIPAEEGAIRVNLAEFASLPDIDGVAARMMLLVDEPGTRRLFVNDMRGPLYSVSYDGKAVTLYLDINAATWGVPRAVDGAGARLPELRVPPAVRAGRHARLRQVLHLDRHEQHGAARRTSSRSRQHHAAHARHRAARVDREDAGRRHLRRRPAARADAPPPAVREPQRRPDGVQPAAPRPASPDFGLLYIGVADGGSGGDPLRMAQNLGTAFGKILRIDPLGTNSANKKYGIPPATRSSATPGALPEIYAYGVRNPQRFAWDSRNGNLFLADIGQNIVEEISLVTAGANLGWNDWEGSFRFISRTEVGLDRAARATRRSPIRSSNTASSIRCCSRSRP